LKVVTKEEARQHHRVRSDSKSGAKGVRYNEDTDSWSAYLYRGGLAFHVGTFHRREQAELAYQEALRRENPELHTAPKTVERQRDPAPVQQVNPDGPSMSESNLGPAKAKRGKTLPSGLIALATMANRRCPA
jgi:hypothetical protein